MIKRDLSRTGVSLGPIQLLDHCLSVQIISLVHIASQLSAAVCQALWKPMVFILVCNWFHNAQRGIRCLESANIDVHQVGG